MHKIIIAWSAQIVVLIVTLRQQLVHHARTDTWLISPALISVLISIILLLTLCAYHARVHANFVLVSALARGAYLFTLYMNLIHSVTIHAQLTSRYPTPIREHAKPASPPVLNVSTRLWNAPNAIHQHICTMIFAWQLAQYLPCQIYLTKYAVYAMPPV